MRSAIVAVCAIVALSAAARGQDKPPMPPDTWPQIDKAAALVREGKLAEAGEVANEIVKLDPSQAMGYAFRIDLAERAGDDAAVVKACDDLAAGTPIDPKVKDAAALQQRRCWRYYAARAKGEALYRQKKFDEAAASFSAARQLSFECIREFDPTMTRQWQALMDNRQADALREAGKTGLAVGLRREILRRYDQRAIARNFCVRVKAALVRDLRADGKADEAKKVLDEALADAGLDAAQKSWLAAEADGKPWTPPKPDDRLVAHDAPESFVVRSEGRWEMRVDLTEKERYGTVGQWYDLASDPLRERNLMTTSFFSLIKPHHVGYTELRDGKWQGVDYDRFCRLKDKIDVGQTKAQNKFEVIENGPARVRCGYTHRSWPNESLVYTFYPDGRVYAAFHLSLVHPDGTVKINSIGFYMAVAGTTNWRTTLGKLTGMIGSPGIQGQAPFTMMHGNPGYPSYADPTLAAIALGPRNAADAAGSYGNNMMPLAWFRTPIEERFKPDEKPEADRAFLIHFWPDGRIGFDAEKPYMDDFQNPATPAFAKGKAVTDDPGDFDKDGFNEAEGCYVARAAAGEVEFTIDGAKTTRFSPVFKVVGAKGAAIEVTLDGKPLAEGTGVSTAFLPKDAGALVRVIGPVTTAAKLRIAIQ